MQVAEALPAAHRGHAPLPLVERIEHPAGPADAVATELVDRAEISGGKHIVKLTKTEAAISALRADMLAQTFSCATVKDDKATRQFRARCVSMRVAIKDHCLGLRAPAKKFAEDVIAEQARLIALVEAIEAVPEAIIKADEKAKAERKAIEDARIAAISARIQHLQDMPVRHIASNANTLAILLADLQILDLANPPEEFGEFAPQADVVRAKVLTALSAMHDAAIDREAIAEHARVQTKAAEEQRKANEARTAQLAAMAEVQAAESTVADEALKVAEAAATNAREALAKAEAAVRRVSEQAEAAAATARQKLREARANAAGELYVALFAVFGDDGFDLLTEPTRELVTKGLQAASLSAARSTAVEVSHA